MNMRILLNLLPEERKAALAVRFFSRFFLWQTALVLLLLLFYISILGGIYFLLRHEAAANQNILSSFDQFDTETKRLLEYQEAFKETNAVTEDLSRYFSRHLEWGKLFRTLEALTPDGVVYSQLLTKDYTVSLVGQAETREQFLAFEAALKGSDCVSDVKVPLSNLFSQTELDFQIDFNIRPACLESLSKEAL